MNGSATMWKAASLAAPVGWAFDEWWRKFVVIKWRELCAATGCGSGEKMAHTGERAVAAAIALTFWPEWFDKQVDAARAFGAPARLLSRRLLAVRTFLNGETPQSFAIPPDPCSPYPNGLATPRLALPTSTSVSLSGMRTPLNSICPHMNRRLQPYTCRRLPLYTCHPTATLRATGCSPICCRLQPFISQGHKWLPTRSVNATCTPTTRGGGANGCVLLLTLAMGRRTQPWTQKWRAANRVGTQQMIGIKTMAARYSQCCTHSRCSKYAIL